MQIAVRSFVAALTAVVALGGVACENDVVDDGVFNVVDDASDEAAVTYVEPNTVASTRLYLGIDNFGMVSWDEPLFYGHFNLLPRGKVDVTVARGDGVDDVVGFKVYRVNPRGTLRYLGQVEGYGSVAARVDTRAGGTIVIEATTPPDQWGTAGLNITVECKRRDGNCAPLQQPNEQCGGRGGTPCDDGLFCNFSADCGRADQGGTCMLPPDVCPRSACVTLCGCDGVDYCGACDANRAGVAVDHEGSCVVEEPVCDPAVYDRADGRQVNMHGIWTFKERVDGFDVVATLGLYDGDFSYTQVWNPTCLSEPPFCRRPSLMFSMTGGWTTPGNTSVQLSPDAESTPAPEQLAQAFSIVENCEGDFRLRTTELGLEREFTRDLCADFHCDEETSHCELVDVQCIQAPCPAQPTCVPN